MHHHWKYPDRERREREMAHECSRKEIAGDSLRAGREEMLFVDSNGSAEATISCMYIHSSSVAFEPGEEMLFASRHAASVLRLTTKPSYNQ